MFLSAIVNKYKLVLYTVLFLGTASLFIGSYFYTYFAGKTNGKEEIQFAWNKDKLARAEQIQNLMNDYSNKEAEHRLAIRNIKNEFTKVKSEYNENIAFIKSDYTNRLQQSNQRAAVYKRQAESGEIGCRLLSEHTARLDQSITEGRRLVGELAETVRQCGTGIDLLVEIIETDRKILE